MDELPLPQLRALVAVAEARSFSRAARALGISQSTVSTQILRLEQRVGATLIERTTRSVEPTAAAQRLLPIARDILRLQRIASSRLDARPLSGMVVFAADESAALAHGLIELARGFNEVWPDVDLRVEVAPAAALLERFAAGLVDVAVVHGADDAPVRHGPPPWSSSELGRDRLRWYGNAAASAPDPRWPIVGLPRGGALRARVERALADTATPHRTVFEADSLSIGIEAARRGFGLIALPEPAARRHLLEAVRAGGLPALGSCPVRLLQRADPSDAAAALRNEVRSAWPARRSRGAPPAA
ncbi:MAG: LysR family transcriptional regulator [Burkholderiaceae bacterium]